VHRLRRKPAAPQSRRIAERRARSPVPAPYQGVVPVAAPQFGLPWFYGYSRY
jgi:hypothetical protein